MVWTTLSVDENGREGTAIHWFNTKCEALVVRGMYAIVEHCAKCPALIPLLARAAVSRQGKPLSVIHPTGNTEPFSERLQTCREYDVMGMVRHRAVYVGVVSTDAHDYTVSSNCLVIESRGKGDCHSMMFLLA